MLRRILKSIASLFRALDAMRLLPSDTIFPPGINVFSLSSLVIVSIIFVIARGIVAFATHEFTAALILTVASVILFFIIGFCARFVVSTQTAARTTSRTATWLFIFWIICIVIIDLTDVPLVSSGYFPVGYYVFSYFPIMILGIEPPVWWPLDFLRAVLLSLIAWCLLLLKTKIQVKQFSALRAFISWQFPLFVGMNSVLIWILVLSLY